MQFIEVCALVKPAEVGKYILVLLNRLTTRPQEYLKRCKTPQRPEKGQPVEPVQAAGIQVWFLAAAATAVAACA
jgi:hypothetical protein